jgi:hypothetical protein
MLMCMGRYTGAWSNDAECAGAWADLVSVYPELADVTPLNTEADVIAAVGGNINNAVDGTLPINEFLGLAAQYV